MIAPQCTYYYSEFLFMGAEERKRWVLMAYNLGGSLFLIDRLGDVIIFLLLIALPIMNKDTRWSIGDFPQKFT